MPEYLTERDVSDELCGWARTWLDDPVARARATANLAALRHRVARPGASQRAAGRIVAWLRDHAPGAVASSLYRGPHESALREETFLEQP